MVITIGFDGSDRLGADHVPRNDTSPASPLAPNNAPPPVNDTITSNESKIFRLMNRSLLNPAPSNKADITRLHRDDLPLHLPVGERWPTRVADSSAAPQATVAGISGQCWTTTA
jgi:hypothetical protein